MEDLISEVVPPTIVEEAYQHKMRLIQTSGIYGMRYDEEMQRRLYSNTAEAVAQRFGKAWENVVFAKWKRRHEYNNRLKRHHEPMKRRGELTVLDINMKKWKKRFVALRKRKEV